MPENRSTKCSLAESKMAKYKKADLVNLSIWRPIEIISISGRISKSAEVELG